MAEPLKIFIGVLLVIFLVKKPSIVDNDIIRLGYLLLLLYLFIWGIFGKNPADDQ
jgi:uncharacterized membrane protein YjgN (DUF898 family)